jgi:putative oxidoreductase
MRMLIARYERVAERLSEWDYVPKLLMRLFIGYFFVETGFGKVTHLGSMVERFTQWGIPFPAFNAALSSYTELLGGALVLLGLFTRLVSVPLFINMVVATLTVKLKKVAGLDDFVELDEPLYALVFLWLAFSGPGKLSLDFYLRRLRSPRTAGHP